MNMFMLVCFSRSERSCSSALVFSALPSVPHPSLYAAPPGWWHAPWGYVSTALCGLGHPSAAYPTLRSSPPISLLVSLSQELSTPPLWLFNQTYYLLPYFGHPFRSCPNYSSFPCSTSQGTYR